MIRILTAAASAALVAAIAITLGHTALTTALNLTETLAQAETLKGM